MSDRFGAVDVPLLPSPAPTDGVTDPALSILGRFIAAVLNANAQQAADAVVPQRSGVSVPVVRAAFTHDPKLYIFNESALPALFIWRARGKPSWLAEDIRQFEDELQLLWVFMPASQEVQVRRDPLLNGITKLLDYAIESYRSPSYVFAGDSDPQAATLARAPTSIKLQFATSVAPQSFSGAQLDGSIGIGDVSPRRAIGVSLAGDPSAFADGSTVTITGRDVLGSLLSIQLTIARASIPYVLATGNDFSSVESVSIDSQLSTAGTISIGTESFAGLGSQFMVEAGLTACKLSEWKDDTLVIDVPNGDKRAYPALGAVISITELLKFDLTTRPENNGSGSAFVRSDGSVIEQALYP